MAKYPEHQVSEIFEDCTVPEVFRAIFSDHPIKYNGKTYATPWLVLKVANGDTDITHTQWKPPEPVMFAKALISDSTLKELQEYDSISKREYKYVHPLREQSVFAPKTATVEERHTIFWLSFDEVVVQTEIHLSKVPFSDCFTVKNCFQIKQIEPTKVQFTWKGWVDIFKSFMFKGKAYKGSVEEMEDYRKRIFMPILRENFKVLQSKKRVLKAKIPQSVTSKHTTAQIQNPEKSAKTAEATKKDENKVASKQAVEEEEEIEIEEEIIINASGLTAKNINALRERGNKIRTLGIALDKFISPVFKETFDGGIFEAFNSIFSETPVTLPNGSKYNSPWDCMRAMQADTNIEPAKFYPAFPKYYLKGDQSEEAIKELLSYPNKSERTAKFTHPVREQSMFAPKTCTAIEKTTIYWLSHEELIVQIQVNTENIPFCDTFVTRVNYVFKQTKENQCVVEHSMFVDFLKNPMFKGKILKATTDEVLESGKTKILKMAKDLVPFFAKLKVSSEPQKIKVKKKIKAKKAASARSESPNLDAEKAPEDEQNLPELAPKFDPVDGEDQVDVAGPQDLKENDAALNNSPVIEELLKKLSSMDKTQKSLTDEMRSLKFVLMALIGINLAMLWFIARRI